METGDYTIRTTSPSDLPQVLDLMRENFYFEENMCKLLCERSKITDDERGIITEISDGSVRAILQGSTCFVAVHSSGIVGANLTLLSENPGCGEGKDALAGIFPSNPHSPVIEEYHKYLMDINDRANLFNRYQVKNLMEFYAVAVDKNHRRKGIAQELISRGISWARDQAIPLVFGVFTSPFSMKSAQRAGMTSILDIDLLEYKDHLGEPIFQGIPANIVNVMVRETKNL
ncbi:uncharacterized protein [Fopius arisanus]|uniref:N-acetyltransferase domain-containing protein n=1 Tax=Fopius arisanus TaxID=64838 RepID=A0A9R1T5Y5_9HYME|nr:PREDICTED: uncharacterized protein LOC105266657 [Fopius arisanus]XP_011303309.1 PREDICTED: uncharacterized protein LOC105266657 [Fopius arisanus]